MNELELKLCDIQGRLFELSADRKFGSIAFVKEFMASDTAKALDSTYNRMQWAGEEYLLEEVADASDHRKLCEGEVFEKEVLYWMGYVYRYWHYYTGESSAKIYRQASAKTMKRNYLMFHTMDPSLAVEDLKEIYCQKQSAISDKTSD